MRSSEAIADPDQLLRTSMVVANPAWLVAHGRVSTISEECYWYDDHCAVLNGAWEISPSERFIVAGGVSLTNRGDVQSMFTLQSQGTGLNDLRLVAMLWDLHGEQTTSLLYGSFGFSVWDRDKQSLFLVRDRVGVETLYYTTEGSMRYAGQRAQIERAVSREIDLVAVRDYLCCAFVPGERTMWQGVREVAPGTIVSLPEGESTIYWALEDRTNDQLSPIEDYSSRLRQILERAVRGSLPDDEPLGVYLSGGLDSSCVAAIAARLHNQPVHSYSIHFGPECPNELEFSSLVAEHCRTQHHIIEITPQSMWDLLPETMGHLDDPIGDPLTVPNLILGRTAKTTVNTILNGEGGDPCFGGPKNQPMILSQLYSSSTPGELNSLNDVVLSYLRSFQKCATDLPQLLRPEVWAQVSEAPSVFAEAFNSRGSYLNRLMFINTRFKGADHILTKVGNLTRAAGLRGRSPLFDDRLVELSLEIPPQYKLDGACEKAVLKTAVADLLPISILERPKSGMMVPVQRWFRERWSEQTRAILLSRHARVTEFLNQELVGEWLNYRGDVWSRYGVKLWLLVSLELWLQGK
jgi:asparagine synthase (glutamine-hydrolysing)